jgi:hypothetical protein
MKKFSLIVGLLLLTSCKSSKSGCDAYGNNIMKSDSINVKVEHCHIEEENYCYYSIDTIYLFRSSVIKNGKN